MSRKFDPELTLTLTMTESQWYAVLQSIRANREVERELPMGDPNGNPTWRLDRMVAAQVAEWKMEAAMESATRD
jgi:hypothetical protein